MKKVIVVVSASLVGVLLLLLVIAAPGVSVREEEKETDAGGEQIVQTALGEVGNVGGAKFWSWYGFSSRVEWCACFVSWCADQCGYIDLGVIPKFSYCPDGVAWFKNHDQWQGSSYTPKAGDIIFFDWNHDGTADHVGIVQYAENDRIITVEGNTSSESEGNGDRCEVKNRSAAYVLGYGTPAYPDSDVDLGNGEAAEQVYTFLTAKGYSHAAACGILGNLYQESGVNPTMIQNGGGGPAAGICQWENYNTKSGRWKAMADYALSKGKDWTDLKCQLEYMLYELEGGDSTCKYLMEKNYGGLTAFKKTDDVVLATQIFEKCFERAGVPLMEKRIAAAKLYDKEFR